MNTKTEVDLIESVLETIKQAKAIEDGKLSVEEFTGEDERYKIEHALNKVTKEIVHALEKPELASDVRLQSLVADSTKEITLSLPIEKDKYPYTTALLLFQAKQLNLKPHQEKSPFADLFPGKIEDQARVVQDEKVQVNLDFADLSYLRMLVAPGNWKSTGLYAPAGSTITIEVPAGIDHLDIQVGTHTDELGHLIQWDRAPIITLRDTLKPGTNEISSPFGGLIYLIPTKSSPKETIVKVSGAVKAPYFILGETTVEEWQAKIKNFPAPWAELQGKNVIHAVPSSVIRNLDKPDELMRNWDDFVDQYNELVGLGEDRSLPHRTPDRQHRYTSDIQISAGYMHAGYPMMIPITPAAKQTVDFTRIKDLHDGWGFWHEMGHEYQQVAWFWDDIVEVSVNIYSLYIQDYYKNPSRLLTVDKNGQTYYEIAFEFLAREDANKNFNEIGLFERLVMIRQLQLAYDWDFFTNLHIAYRELPEADLPQDHDEQQKIDTFVLMCSKVCGEDLLEFFSKWGMPYSDQAKENVAALNLPAPQTKLWTLKESGLGPAY